MFRRAGNFFDIGNLEEALQTKVATHSARPIYGTAHYWVKGDMY